MEPASPSFLQINDTVEITTPYLDRHNDHIQFYVQKTEQGLLLTDDAYTIQDLQLSGCDLSSKKRQDLLHTVLRGFGVQLQNDALTVEASPETFAQKKHNLMQAILAVNDLFYVSATTVESLFGEEIVTWLRRSRIRFTPRVKLTGKSGFDYLFDFVIPESPNAPERLVQTINHPNRNKAQIVMFAWSDIRDIRAPNSRAYVILNDSEQQPRTEMLTAFQRYDIRAVLWSRHEEVLSELEA